MRVRLTGQAVSSVELSSEGPCRVVCDGGRLLGQSVYLDDAAVRRGGRYRIAGFSPFSTRLEIIPSRGSHVTLNGRKYRGSIRLVARGSDHFMVVNCVDMESYLAGVLAKELYSYWHEETFRAQAVAARTFAYYQMTHFGRTHDYDLTDTQSSQVYGGFSGETNRAWDAVRATHGKVLAYGGIGEKGEKKEKKVLHAHYSACCGGVVNSAIVLRESANIPPLRGGQKCEHCKGSPRYRWPAVKVPTRQLYEALKAADMSGKLSDVKSIRVLSRTSYGRAIRAELADSRGRTVEVRFDSLRVAMLRGHVAAAKGLHSMNCEVRIVGQSVEFYNGRGFGHGVGLCQWGAQGKAKAGWSAERILKFYYPQASIISKY